MMTQPDFIPAADVARLIGLDSAAAFLRQRPRLEHDEHFPMPMPTRRRQPRWRRDRVLAWVAEQGLPRAVSTTLPPRPEGANVVLLEMART